MVRRALRALRTTRYLVLINAAVVAILVAIGAELVRNWIAGTFANSTTLLSLVSVVVLLLVFVQQVRLRDDLTRLARRQRFSVAFYSAEGEGAETDGEQLTELHRAAAQVIRQAERGSSVLAVNSYLEVGQNSDTQRQITAAAKDYLKEYEKRFDDLDYHRLIQVEDADRAEVGSTRGYLRTSVNEAYYAHYRAIAEYSAANESRPVKIEEVRPAVPISFVVVAHAGGGQIIWQVHRHADPGDERGTALKMLGILIINDPDGLLVPTFHKWFTLIDRGNPNVLTPRHFTADRDG